MKVKAAIGRMAKQYGRGYEFILFVNDEDRPKLNRIMRKIEKEGTEDGSYNWQLEVELEVSE